MKLDVGHDDLASCVQCGLCLPHCPTWRVSGEETASPRGRIAAMRLVDSGAAPADDTFVGYMEACVQCRGCEAACPSGVPFGALMAGTKASLPPRRLGWRRHGYRVLGHHRLLLGLSSLLAIVQRVGLVPRRLGLPRLPVFRRRLRGSSPTTADVVLFTGCVMDAWQRPVHEATVRVMQATGAQVAVVDGGCCGALHEHAGLAEDAHRLAARVVASLPADLPVVVNSAGCGAAMKALCDRALDVHEWLATRALPPAARRLDGLVAIQDPCHLRHVQRAHQHVRTVLAPYVDVVELDDDGLCCGAGGAYALFNPETAGEIRERKLASIARSGATAVASANPGCAMHLSAAGLDVRHPVELMDAAIRGAHGR